MIKQEINPYTGKPLNPELEVTRNGRTTRVEYIEDYFKETGVFDSREGRRVFRLNRKLSRDEWNLVKKQFKKYHEGWFTWGTAKPEIAISLLVKAEKPHIDHVVCRHRLTADGVRKLKKHGGNLIDGLTGESLFGDEDSSSI